MRQDVSTVVTGYTAENLALQFLVEKQGMRFLDRNIEACGAEVDLVMQDGDTWVFVEVRARSHYRDVHPFETIDRQKQLKIIRVAKCYLQNAGSYYSRAARFDAVAVCLGTGEVDWIPNAFQV